MRGSTSGQPVDARRVGDDDQVVPLLPAEATADTHGADHGPAAIDLAEIETGIPERAVVVARQDDVAGAAVAHERLQLLRRRHARQRTLRVVAKTRAPLFEAIDAGG